MSEFKLILIKSKLMTFKTIDSTDLAHFVSIIGIEYVLTDSESLDTYSHDETEDLKYFPEVVLKPNNTNEVAAIMLYCNQQLISVTPCGARTGLSGGSLPVCGGVVLSTERFNRIIEIDERNLQAIVEPGVINQIFQEAVQAKGLYYPQILPAKEVVFWAAI